MVERLKARALIEVGPDADDRRKVIVRLTATGVALVGHTVPFAREVTEQTYGELNAGERVALQFLLRKMIQVDGE